jgi:hypothetical protein
MIVYPGCQELPHIDALLILGRGVDEQGALSETGQERVQAAAWLGAVLAPELRVIVASGARSWKQTADGIITPSEGGTMLQDLTTTFETTYGGVPDGLELQAEEASTSTVENFVNSSPLLNLQKGERLGVLSDPLHFMFYRPQYLGRLTLPDTCIVPLELPAHKTPTLPETTEELVSTIAARILMAGVKKGNHDSIMRQQRRLQAFNTTIRTMGRQEAKAS